MSGSKNYYLRINSLLILNLQLFTLLKRIIIGDLAVINMPLSFNSNVCCYPYEGKFIKIKGIKDSITF